MDNDQPTGGEGGPQAQTNDNLPEGQTSVPEQSDAPRELSNECQEPKPEPKPAPRPEWEWPRRLRSLRMTALIVPLAITAVVLVALLFAGLEKLAEVGIIQPVLAATVSFAIVAGIRVTKGRYKSGHKKGEVSPSDALLAGRLWLQVFLALMAAILLSSVAQRLPLETLGKKTELQAEAGEATATVAIENGQ